MSDFFDIAIIGAGPAGSSAAITAARAGAHVLLLERGSFPRQKVCGEFVSPESLELLRGLFGESEAGEVLTNAVRISRALTFIDGEVIDTRISPAAFSIPRYELDAALWRIAQLSGVDTRQQLAVQRVNRNRDGNSGFCIEGASGEKFLTRAVINASGRWSNLKAASVKIPAGTKWIGLKAHFAEPATAASPSLDLHFFDGGYCGVSPIVMDKGGVNHINACAMVRADVAKTLADVFACEVHLAERARNWKPMIEEVTTAPLVFHPPAPVAGDVLLAGDAAGFIDPFVGDGISLALHSGAMAAEALIQSGYKVEEARALYRTEYERNLLPAFNNAARLRKLMSLPQLVRWPAIKAMQVSGISEFVLKQTRAGAGGKRKIG